MTCRSQNLKFPKKKLLLYEEIEVAVEFLHTEFKSIFWNFSILTSTYDLYAPYNVGRFRLDRVCTKHVV
jgi:hypothetical protein